MGGELRGVFTLRTTLDADGLAPVLDKGGELLIVGGGYIGLEVAAVAAKAGLTVTVVEMADRILQRVASEETSNYFRDLHTRNNVRIMERTALGELLGEGGAVTGARIGDEMHVDTDAVLCGIGIVPDVSLAEEAGLTTDNGIAVDSQCRTSDPHIYAAGDCAGFEFRGQQIRLESVPNAIHQAETAAQNMLGESIEYVAKPWFWSDQYDVKLQIAGLNSGYTSTVVRPGKRDGAQSVWYYQGETLLAVDAMNDAPAFMTARRLIDSGASVPPQMAADPAVALKDFG